MKKNITKFREDKALNKLTTREQSQIVGGSGVTRSNFYPEIRR
jgi:hypothetical protein